MITGQGFNPAITTCETVQSISRKLTCTVTALEITFISDLIHQYITDGPYDCTLKFLFDFTDIPINVSIFLECISLYYLGLKCLHNMHLKHFPSRGVHSFLACIIVYVGHHLIDV